MSGLGLDNEAMQDHINIEKIPQPKFSELKFQTMIEDFLDTKLGRKFLRSRKLVEENKSNKVSVTSSMLKIPDDISKKESYNDVVVEETSLKDLEMASPNF